MPQAETVEYHQHNNEVKSLRSPKDAPMACIVASRILFVPLLLWDCLCILIGVLGIIIYGSFTSTLGPVYVINQNIGVWMCLMLGYVASQNLYYAVRAFDARLKIASFVFNLMFFGSMLLLSLINFFGYCIYSMRSDAMIWSLMIAITCFANLVAIFMGWFTHLNPLIKEKDFDSQSTSYQLFGSNKSVTIDKKLNALFICGIVCNIIIRIIFFLIMVLIAAGAANNAQITRFPRRGKIAKVELNDGSRRFQNIHYICEGPTESTPVFIFEGDASHGFADYVDIQKHLTDLGRRSCIYDKPGLGYSDFLFKDQKNVDTFYHNFMKSIGEKTPYVMVGWGGGGSIIYKYAKDHPEMVKSLTFLDVFPEGIEFTSVRDLKKLTQSEYLAYKNSDLSTRQFLMNLINAVGVPFGLMSAFVYSDAQTTNKYEISFWMKTEKTWITQSVALDQVVKDDFSHSVFNETISSTIPINLVISKHDDNWVLNNHYSCKQLGSQSEECQYEIQSNKYYINSQVNIVPNLNGGSITYCTDDLCSQGYYTFINPKYTAETLQNLYPQ